MGIRYSAPSLNHSARCALYLVGSLILSVLMVLSGCNPAPSESRQSDRRQTETGSSDDGIRLIGEVQLEGAEQLAGVQIFIPGTSRLAFTDDQGIFEISDLGPGVYQIYAREEGYQTASFEPVTISAETEGPLQLGLLVLQPRPTLTPALGAENSRGSIDGQLSLAMDEQPNGTIQWQQFIIKLQGTAYRTTTDDDGKFLLWSLPPDTYTAVVERDGTEVASQDIRVLPGPEATPLEIAIDPAQLEFNRQILGNVRMFDAQGNPTNDFDRVIIDVIDHPNLSTTIGPDGSFTLSNLAPDIYLLIASAEGYGRSSPVEIDLTELPQVETMLTLEAEEPQSTANGMIRGLVIKNRDDVLDMSGITVALAGTSILAMTDLDGVYNLTNVPPGTYQILAKADGYETAQTGPVEIAAGAEVEAEAMLLEPILEYPQVMRTEPADGARDLVIRREIPITVRFNKKMVPESLRQAVSIEPEVAFRVFSGRDLPDTDFDLMKVVLFGAEEEPALQFETRYELRIDTTAEDFEGLQLQEPFEMRFTTGDPAVIGTLPEDGGIKETFTQQRPVAIYFNAPMDPGTLTQEVLRIRPRLSQTPLLATEDDPVTGWTRLYIQANWEPETEYEITVQRRAKTRGKDSLSNTPYRFSFKTAKLVKRLAPQPSITRR